MLNQDKPKEYVLSSNETHTIREFVELAFEAAGICGAWWSSTGIAEDEEYVLAIPESPPTLRPKITLMKINPKFYRPAEVELLWGDSTNARAFLNWEPKTNFKGLVQKMVDSDLSDAKLERG